MPTPPSSLDARPVPARPEATSAALPYDFSLARLFTMLYGAAFLLIGLLGFTETGLAHIAEPHGHHELAGFQVNPLHNALHVVIGALGLVAAWRLSWVQIFGVAAAGAYGAVLVYGLFAAGAEWDVLAINTADNWLHLGGVIAALLLATLAGRERRAYGQPGDRPRRISARQH